MALDLRRLGLLMCAAWLLACSAAQSQAPREADEVSTALSSSSFTRAAEMQMVDARFRADRRAMDALELRVQRGEVERSELTAKQQETVRRLEAANSDYAEQLAVFRESVQRVAKSDDGRAALARFNRGEIPEALADLERLAAARREQRQPQRDQEDAADAGVEPDVLQRRQAARAKQRGIEDAVDLRDIARLALDAQQRQRLGLGGVIERFTRVVALDPGVAADSIALARLFRQAWDLARMQSATQAALRAASDERERAAALSEAGSLLRLSGRLQPARAHFVDALALRQKLADAQRQRADLKRELSVAHERMGELELDDGRPGQAVERFTTCVSIREALIDTAPSPDTARRDLSVALLQLARARMERGELDAASKVLERGLQLSEELVGKDPNHLELQRDRAVALARAADLAVLQGRPEAAQDLLDRSLKIRLRLVEGDGSSLRLQRDAAAAILRRGELLLQVRDDLGEVERHYRDAQQRLERQRPEADQKVDLLRDLSSVQVKMAGLRATQGDRQGALSTLREVSRRLEEIDRNAPGQYLVQRDLAGLQVRVGDVLLSGGDARGARERYGDFLKRRTEFLRKESDSRMFLAGVALAHAKLTLAYKYLGDRTQADREYRAAQEGLARVNLPGLPPLHGYTEAPELLVTLALASEAMEDTAYAERLRQVGDQLRRSKLLTQRQAADVEATVRRTGRR